MYVHYQHSKKNSLDQLGEQGQGQNQVQQKFMAEIKDYMAKGWLGLWESVLDLVVKVEGSKVIIFEAHKSTANSAAELVLLFYTFRKIVKKQDSDTASPFYSSKDMTQIPLSKINELGKKALRDLEAMADSSNTKSDGGGVVARADAGEELASI